MSKHRINFRTVLAWRVSIHALLGACLAASSAGIADSSNASLGLPPILIPADNLVTPEKIALGKKLFFDRRLSKNGTLSCAMCHIPEQGFTQNELATSVGFEGKSLRRNAPSLLNVALHDSFQRDGAKASLEVQVWGPLLAHDEMANGSVENVVARINALPDYFGLFESAFAGRGGDEITIGQALATFERTLLSGNSRFDRWYFGSDQSAPSEQEQAGFRVFIAAGCNRCHLVDERSATFTDNRFHNTGVTSFAQKRDTETVSVQLAPGVRINIRRDALANVSEPIRPDLGRYEVTGEDRDQDAFKTPTLRNIALTAPYMHDGFLPTLETVIEFYASDFVSHDLKDVQSILQGEAEKSALLAFLRSLTGELPTTQRD